MRFSKVLFVGLIFMVVSIYWSGVPSNVSAEDKVLLAADVSKQLTPVKPLQPDCKATETKDKDGKMVIKLEGKGCQKVVEGLGSGSKACCVCTRERPGEIWICRGTCCVGALGKIVNITR